MDDLISRQVVLKELEEYIVNAKNAISEHPDDIYNYNSGLLTAIQVVTDTPSAQSERKRGKWILSDEQREEDVSNGNYQFYCSECGHGDLQSKSVTVSFCWNCGARMNYKETDDAKIH